MEEAAESRVLKSDKPQRRKLGIKLTDVLIFGAVVIVIVVLSLTIIHKLGLKQEVAQARPVADKVVNAMAKQDTASIRAMGDKKFQADHTAAELNSVLTFQTTPPISFAQMYGDSKPVGDIALVANNASGQHVVIIYRYDKLKVPFYVRIETVKPPSSQKWYLEALSASPNEVTLTSGL